MKLILIMVTDFPLVNKMFHMHNHYMSETDIALPLSIESHGN